MYRLFVFLLLWGVPKVWAVAQPASGTVTVRATEYNTDPNGLPLGRYWTLLDATAILPSDPLNTPLPFEVTLRNYDGRAREVHFLAIKNGNLNVVFPPPRATAPSPGTLAAAPQPNPTPGPVWFGVYLPEPTTLYLEVFDVGGRRVYADRWPGQAGAQQIELPATALPIAGIYFWRISAETSAQASGKIVRM
jgi:hypothetical protein